MTTPSTCAANRSYARRAFLTGALTALLSVACVRTRAPSIPTETIAPAFSLTDSTGKQVSLADLTAQGPGVVVFYRGFW